MKRGVIFDKDGTLLDFEAFWLPVTEGALNELAHKFCVSEQAVRAAEEKLGISGGRAERNGVLCAGTYAQMAEIVREVFSEYGTEAAEREMYREVCRAFEENMHRGEILPSSARLKDTLLALKKEDYRLFVATTDNAGITAACLQKLGIEGLFDGVYTDGAGYPAKPDPFIVDMIVKEHGAEREGLAMVGDTRTDLFFARRGRILGIGYAQNEREKRLLAPLADEVIGDFCELPEILKRRICVC